MIPQIIRLLTTIWYRLTSPSYRLLEKSGLFDRAYYLKQNPDVASSGADPLSHYLNKGFIELRQPGPLFDARYYQQQVPSLLETGENPLLHFLKEGRYLGFTSHSLFDVPYYVEKNPGVDFSLQDPLTHFLLEGRSDDKSSPSPYFDPEFYCNKYPDAARLISDPQEAYKHYLLIGLAQKRLPSALFDTGWYLDKTPVLHEQGLDPISHYYMFGISEKKSPSPLFDPHFYKKTYTVTSNEDLFAHYLRTERVEEKRPCSWFDPAFYRKQYIPATDGVPPSPLEHYLRLGHQAKFYPNRNIAELVEKPLISVIVPVYNVAPALLNNCIRSVLFQSYPHWELCLADDCSTNEDIRPLLEQWARSDDRIKVVFLPENGGISAATNAAVGAAGGSYLAFLDNDDELSLEALFIFAQAINKDNGDLFYSDEDLIGADATRFSVFRKPGFNRELLLCHNYITHCVVARKSLYEKVGGCDSELNGAQDLDLFLKLSEQAVKIIHIPQILYHWRASESSTSINHAQKEYANEAGRKSVVNALSRVGIDGTVHFTGLKFFYRAQLAIRNDLAITVVVDWQRPIGEIEYWLARLINSAGYTICQLVIAVPSSEMVEPVQTSGSHAGINTICFISPTGKSPAATFNSAAEYFRGEYVAFVDSWLDRISDGWLSALVEYGQQAGIGMVGGKIEFPADHPNQVTPIPDCSNASPSYYARFLVSCSVLMNGLQCPQEVRSVGGELFFLRTDLFKELGGFDHGHFPVLFFVADLCYRLHTQGKVNIFTPHCSANLPAVSGITECQDPEELQLEKQRFQQKWPDLLKKGDPFYNPGLLEDNLLSIDEFQNWLTGSSTAAPHTTT